MNNLRITFYWKCFNGFMCLFLACLTALLAIIPAFMIYHLILYFFSIPDVGFLENDGPMSNSKLVGWLVFILVWLGLIGDAMEKTGHLLKSAEERGELRDFDN